MYLKILILLVLHLSTNYSLLGQTNSSKRIDYSELNLSLSSDSASKTVIYKIDLIYIPNNGIDTITLIPGYEIDIAEKFDLYLIESPFLNLDSAITYHTQCENANTRVIDVIDLNNDGYKDLIISKEWGCSVSPSNIGVYGEGGQRHQYSTLEIWDTKNRRSIFKVDQKHFWQIAVTTNTITTGGYELETRLGKTGSLSLSLKSGEYNGNLELGKYKFSEKSNFYVKQ